jgi:DnaJ-class molecular chaperone
VLRDMFGGAAGAARARRGGGDFQFEEEEYAPPPGRDVTANTTITLEEAAKGTTRRVQLPTGKELEVKVPAGLTDGQTIRLKWQGLAMPGGNAGDVLITVSIAPHHLFERDGNDLRIELPITLDEAVLGGKVRVPTIDGAVELSIPANTSSGRTFRLKGKGFPAKSGAGDLMATVRIMLPETSDQALEELMKSWRELRPYDPRKNMG